jgi:hypothetical protein
MWGILEAETQSGWFWGHPRRLAGIELLYAIAACVRESQAIKSKKSELRIKSNETQY